MCSQLEEVIILKITMNELAQIVETNDLDPKDGQIIINRFGSYEDIAKEWKIKAEAIVVTDRNQVTEMAMAKEARKKFSEMRLDLEKARKAIGEPAFRKYKAVNAVAKYLQSLIQPIEDHLKLQEDFLKNDNARVKAEMEAEEAERIEAERVAKEKADAEERERIRLENEKLKKEAEEREALIVKEREEAKKKQEAVELKAREEKRALEEKARLEREDAEREKKRIEAEQQKKLDAERKERERIEAELQAKKDEEARVKREAAEAEEKRLVDIEVEKTAQLKRSDREKYIRYIQDLANVPTPILNDAEYADKKEKLKKFFLKELSR